MKKGMCALALLALAATLLASTAVQAGTVYAEVTLAPVGRHYGSPPPLGRKQGWLTITNRDWNPYTLVVNNKDKIFLYRAGDGRGGMLIPSGTTVTIALEKDTYDMYGSSSEKLKVRIREGRTTTLSLEPFGYVGSTGLRGVVNDGERVRNEVLFDAYAAVIVEPAPPTTVIVNRPPPPPPVIINRPPVVVHRPPPPGRPPHYYRPGHGRPPPPPPPRRPHHKKDGWGFVFGISG